MDDIKQALCSAMYRFVSDNIKNLKRDDRYRVDWYGFDNEAHMLKCIKTDWQDAGWALTELCDWGFKDNYRSALFVVDKFDDDSETPIYCIVDDDGNTRYVYFTYPNEPNATQFFSAIHEVKRTVKVVEQVVWVEQNG